MLDYVLLEMRMAELMAQQEASGFRFDMDLTARQLNVFVKSSHVRLKISLKKFWRSIAIIPVASSHQNVLPRTTVT